MTDGEMLVIENSVGKLWLIVGCLWAEGMLTKVERDLSEAELECQIRGVSTKIVNGGAEIDGRLLRKRATDVFAASSKKN